MATFVVRFDLSRAAKDEASCEKWCDMRFVLSTEITTFEFPLVFPRAENGQRHELTGSRARRHTGSEGRKRRRSQLLLPGDGRDQRRACPLRLVSLA